MLSIGRALQSLCLGLLQIREAREGELQALTVEKYLDALCVYFWAATSILTSIITFTLYALLGYHLTADVVFTSLALFNVLIVPLNGFPWVGPIPRRIKLNGIAPQHRPLCLAESYSPVSRILGLTV